MVLKDPKPHYDPLVRVEAYGDLVINGNSTCIYFPVSPTGSQTYSVFVFSVSKFVIGIDFLRSGIMSHTGPLSCVVLFIMKGKNEWNPLKPLPSLTKMLNQKQNHIPRGVLDYPSKT